MPRPHDIYIRTIGGTNLGYMLWRGRNGGRTYQVVDSQAIAPRILTTEQMTQAQLPPDIQLTFPQTNWRQGIGSIRFEASSPHVLADSASIDISAQGILRLARAATASTVDTNPDEYVPSGFTATGDQQWSTIGRDMYQWDFAGSEWDIQTEPVAAQRIYRNGLNFNGTLYIPSWADDAGSGGSYTADDEPISYLYKTLAATSWSVITTAAQGLDGCKYLAVANQALWGGYWASAADSTINLDGPQFDAQTDQEDSSSSSVTMSHTCSGSNRILVVGVGSVRVAGAAYPTGVTYDGQAMTALTTARTTSGTSSVSLWYIVAPSTGANDVVVTFAAAHDDIITSAVSLVGIAQTGTISDESADTGTSTGPSTTLGATAADEWAVDMVFDINGGAHTVGAGQTQRGTTRDGTNVDGANSTEEATGASTTMSWTLGSSVLWLIAAVALTPVTHSNSATSLPTDGTPSSQFVAGDVIRIDSELMLVTAVTDSPPELTVVRGYRGSEAASHSNESDIYEITEDVHHVRSTSDGTDMGNWSTATTIGDAGSPITAIVGVGSVLVVIKTDGIYTAETDGSVTNRLPGGTSMGHADFGRNAWVWNELVFIPLHNGGLWELDVVTWTARDISFTHAMPEQTQYHGRVVAGAGEPGKMYVLVQDSSNTRYHVLMTENPSSLGLQDYNWSEVGRISYTTDTDPDHAAVMLSAVTSGSTTHHRLWVGTESTGSNTLPTYISHSTTDADDAFAAPATSVASSALAVTVAFDGGFPNVEKRFEDITVNTLNLVATGDTGIDTDEALDDSETVIDVDADPTSAIPALSLILIDSEIMLVDASQTSPNQITVVRGYAGTTAATHATNADISIRHWVLVQYRVDGGSWTALTGAQSTSVITADSQTLAFAAGVTGRKIELRFMLARRPTDNGLSPEIHDFVLTCQLRPDAIKLLPLSLYVANGIQLRNGMIENRGKSRRDQLRTWNAQAAEVVVTDTEQGTRNCVFLPGQMREREVSAPLRGFPEYRVDVVLAEVG